MNELRAWCAAAITALALGLVAACSDPAEPEPAAASDKSPAPLTIPDAQAALEEGGVPADGSFSGGTFDLGRTIDGPANAEEARLASASWDVYFVLDSGDVGAWGAGMDVFSSVEGANASARKLADFWICAGPRRPVEGISTDSLNWLDASTCKYPGSEGGYYATLSAADGVVTANLTIATSSREVAEAALVGVWETLSDTLHLVGADLR